ncbi:MAG: universal stress protein [Gordonia sp. (in: high G+C Gram-positive bacteria)]|uniref:universal stress protein n=1 Tax=Gordonia TaxID=2053 RepID=UPI003265C0B1
MTILVAYPHNRRADGVLSLAAMLARSSGEDLVVCTVVVPTVWSSRQHDEMPEYRPFGGGLADDALAHASAALPADVPTRFTTVDARSISAGLIDAAEHFGATMIVVGSAAGLLERITVSSIADRLLHSSPIPVAVAPGGFRGADVIAARLTLAFSSDSSDESQLATATALATRLRADLRLASFAVGLDSPAGVEAAPVDDALFRAWLTATRAAADAMTAAAPIRPELVVGRGSDWNEALEDVDWTPTDVLAIGSSATGPLSRVFIGSRSAKIIRTSPVPVIAVPRVAPTAAH